MFLLAQTGFIVAAIGKVCYYLAADQDFLDSLVMITSTSTALHDTAWNGGMVVAELLTIMVAVEVRMGSVFDDDGCGIYEIGCAVLLSSVRTILLVQ